MDAHITPEATTTGSTFPTVRFVPVPRPVPDFSQVTRVSIIDHLYRDIYTDQFGLVFDRWGVSVEVSIQDDGRTLKVFVSDPPLPTPVNSTSGPKVPVHNVPPKGPTRIENERLRQDLAASKFAEREWRDRAMDLTKDLDELRQEVERLRSDAAYGRTAMDSYAVVQRERDVLREALSHLVDNQWPCDTDNPHVEVWCIAHQTKRCDMDAVVAVARAALAASPTMTEGGE